MQFVRLLRLEHDRC